MGQIIRNIMAILPDRAMITDIAVDGQVFVPAESCHTDNVLDGTGLIAIPGFIDTHIHGYGGYGTEDCSPDSILAMSRLLLDVGVTSFFPTVYTDREEKMIAAIRAIASAYGRESILYIFPYCS